MKQRRFCGPATWNAGVGWTRVCPSHAHASPINAAHARHVRAWTAEPPPVQSTKTTRPRRPAAHHGLGPAPHAFFRSPRRSPNECLAHCCIGHDRMLSLVCKKLGRGTAATGAPYSADRPPDISPNAPILLWTRLRLRKCTYGGSSTCTSHGAGGKECCHLYG